MAASPSPPSAGGEGDRRRGRGSRRGGERASTEQVRDGTRFAGF